MPAQFPRRSGAELYSGMPKLEGVAAIFIAEDGSEVIVLAPNFTALCERTVKWGLPVVDRAKCKTVECVHKPGLVIDEPAMVQSEIENAS